MFEIEENQKEILDKLQKLEDHSSIVDTKLD
jgi:hypothetical protein